MKLKKLLALSTATVLALSVVGCGSSSSNKTNNSAAGTEKAATGTEASSSSDLSYANIELGKTYTDVTASIKFLSHKTDMLQDDYKGTNWKKYIAEFNKMYPNIKVNVEGITNYADDALLRLQGGNWGDVMMIPAVDKKDLGTYFLPYGDVDTMSKQIRYAHTWEYGKQVYGVPSNGTAQGLVYNKKVFAAAGITTLPKTPEEFIKDLQAIKDKTDATPLYTNYAAGWTMGAWDAYIAGNSVGSTTYMNQTLLHTENPFKDYKDDAHPYSVYKTLYDAANQKLIEDDYSTTDWEGCKGMMNSGKIGVMALGSWAYAQIAGAGANAADIGYMPFPITVNGKQYATSGGDYSYGVNAKSSKENQEASMVFVKWMTEKSGFAFNEGCIPTQLSDNKFPDVYASFKDVTLVTDDPAVAGEEDLLNKLNTTSELNVNNSGNDKIQKIIEHASNKDESFDDIMKEWNQKWSDAQKTNNVKVTEK
jgi:ABC-type glycerol-3-phosphate transport system substrate-binding protein